MPARPQPSRRLETVHAGHVTVHQHQIERASSFKSSERLNTVPRGRDGMTEAP
jgi:hypothetical protein